MSALLATAIEAKTGSTVQATVNDTTVTVEVARDLTVAAGDVLLVQRVGSQWFATSRHFAAATTPPETVEPAPPPKPATVSGRLVVAPVETRSYRPTGPGPDWRTDEDAVWQGEYGGYGNNTGCVFYGTKPRSLAGATITSAIIVARRLKGGVYAAQATTMRLMTNAVRPAGAPTLQVASTSGPSLPVGGTTYAFFIANSWAQAMVDGTAGGLAFFVSGGSPYVKFAGRGAWSPAFTLTMNWTR